MSHHITWIIDNDPKGETGRGTLFGCRFKIDGIEHLKTYHLLDQIENNLVWQEIKTLASLAHESNQRIQRQRNSEFEINRQANKKAQEDSKIANIKITKEIRDSINIVLEEYKQLVEQYKAVQLDSSITNNESVSVTYKCLFVYSENLTVEEYKNKLKLKEIIKQEVNQ